jgi:hypothetical protein
MMVVKSGSEFERMFIRHGKNAFGFRTLTCFKCRLRIKCPSFSSRSVP